MVSLTYIVVIDLCVLCVSVVCSAPKRADFLEAVSFNSQKL
ncbi:hypothetical protein MICAI_1160006 [Microcystis sp. T1-4]|nr:hypothetical protein MICAI_1160006 [Microcystis sp. T1-4]